MNAYSKCGWCNGIGPVQLMGHRDGAAVYVNFCDDHVGEASAWIASVHDGSTDWEDPR